MTIGDVFAKAWELWRRDVGWLILAGLVVGLIIGVVAFVVIAIVVGMAAVSIGGIAIGSNNDSAGLTGVGVGTLIVAVILGIVGYLIVSVIGTVFYGGMFEMVIGAARERRGVEFGELFSGFRKFGSFLVFWLVLAGIGIVCGLVLLIPVLGWIAVPVFLAWLGTTWLYVLPLIADRGLTFGEAARASSQMVKGVGWWKTFGTIIVLGVAFVVIALIISLIQRQSSGVGTFLTFVFEILAFPFAICYVSTMYLQSGGEAVGLPAGAYGAAPTPSPFAPPPPGQGQLGQPAPPPPLVAPLVAPLAPPPPPPPVAPPASQEAVTPPPPAPPVDPAAAPDAPPPAAEDVTGVTHASPGEAAAAPTVPEPAAVAETPAVPPPAPPADAAPEAPAEEAVTQAAPVADDGATQVTQAAEEAVPEAAPPADAPPPPEPPAPPVVPGS